MNLLNAAFDYADRGFPVFPLRPGTKVPATANGVKDATTDVVQIHAWWGYDPAHGVGLATGDGLFVVDVDAKAGFDSSESARVALNLPPTYTVATRNGGWHLYYAGDGPNSVGKLLPGVDTRGSGGYVVAPPTPGYEVLWNEQLADLPGAVSEKLAGRASRIDAQGDVVDLRSVLRGVPEGARQDSLFRYTCSLRARGFSSDEASVLLVEAAANCDPPYSRYDALLIVDRVYDTYPAPETSENATQGPLRPILDFTSEPVQWLWHFRIPLGKVTVIAGVQGQGKSYLTAAIAADVTRGRQLPGGVPAGGRALPPSSVLMGAYEDGLGDTLRPRLEQLDADLDRIFVLGTWQGTSQTPRPFRRGDIPALEEALMSMPDVRLLVIDPITSFLGGQVDGNANEAVRDALEPLVALAEKYQVAVVAVAHLNKAELSAALYRVSGANAFTALPRSVLMVGRHPDNGRRGIGHVKSNLGPLADVVEFHIDGEGFRWGMRVNDLPLQDLLKNR